MIWTTAFWKGAGERAFHTFWQTFAAFLTLNIGGELIPDVGFEGIHWTAAFSLSGVATVLSLAKSFSNADFTAGEPKLTEVELAARKEYLDSLTADSATIHGLDEG